MKLSDEDVQKQLNQFQQAFGGKSQDEALLKLQEFYVNNGPNGGKTGEAGTSFSPTTAQFQSAVQDVIKAYNDLPESVDAARLAQDAFTKSGTLQLTALQRSIDSVKQSFNDFGSYVGDLAKTGNLYKAGQDLGSSIVDGLASQFSADLLRTKVIGGLVTNIGADVTAAAQAFADGDVKGGNAIINRIYKETNTAQNAIVRATSAIAPVEQYVSSVFGNSPSGTGLVNQTGVGVGPIRSAAVPTFTEVPGPTGRPKPYILHGNETVRAPEQEDKISTKLDKLIEVMTDSNSQPAVFHGGGTSITLMIDGKEVAARITAIQKNGVGVRKPQGQLGVA